MWNARATRLPPTLLLTLAACGAAPAPRLGSSNTSETARHCPDSKEGSEQLTAAWSQEERTELEVQARNGLVILRYADCELHVLRNCQAKGAYSYAPTPRRDDQIRISSEGELESLMPAQAPRLMGELEREGGLVVQTATVGRYVTLTPTVSPQELEGECEGATHYLVSMTVGAFALGAAPLGSASADPHPSESSPRHRTLSSAGDPLACTAESADAARPPERCAEIVRIQLAPIGSAPKPSEVETPAASPAEAAAPQPPAGTAPSTDGNH